MAPDRLPARLLLGYPLAPIFPLGFRHLSKYEGSCTAAEERFTSRLRMPTGLLVPGTVKVSTSGGVQHSL
jgi:hypothetical protein